MNPRAPQLDLSSRLDERPRVLAVLLDPGRDREDVGIEDDVGGVVSGFLREEAVSALADLDLAVDGVGLSLLVEGHDDHGGSVAVDLPSFRQEVPLALLQADRVHDALALYALEPRLDHLPA